MSDLVSNVWDDPSGMAGRQKTSRRETLSEDTLDTPCIDTQDFIDRCLGNIELADRILAKFLRQFDDELVCLEQEMESRDAEQIRHIAHRLKGTAANVSACRLEQTLAEIEQLASERRLMNIEHYIERLRLEWSRIQAHDPLEI